jgi:hypothetical protein
MEKDQFRKLLDSTFEEVALVMAGILSAHGAQDEMFWQVMKHLDIAHQNALENLGGMPPYRSNSALAPNREGHHPAVDALLLKLRGQRYQP